ncbi:MAG TPA: hypothetical protein VK540_15250 [Polyangiaceae bacterium]|jgi:hypothetical protein|nr:hypothetical protein [Polyangiaceae bacterium]
MKSEVDDWLSELPPLDGADDEPAAEDGTHDDLLPDDEEDASLDDSTADDLEVDDGVDIADDEPGADEDDERWEADVGEPELDLADEATGEAADGDASGVGESDLDLDDDLPPSADDSGEEGTTDAVEQSIDEELPALDADDEGDFEDALLLETGLMVATPEGARWVDEPWERLASADRALALPVPDDDAVACMAMCVAPELVVALTVAGRLLVDGGTNDSRGGWLLPPGLAAGKAGPPLLGVAQGQGSAVLWVASRTGQLARSVDFGRSWSSPVDLGKSILALALASDRAPVVLATHRGMTEILTSVDGLHWDTKPALVEGRALQLGSTSSTWLAAGASCLAIGDANDIWISRHGEDFRCAATTTGTTTGLFTGGADPDAALVFAEAGAEVEESTRLLRVAADGRVEILAEVTPPEDDRAEAPAVLAMAWDELTPSLRVAFSTVVCTLVPTRAKS